MCSFPTIEAGDICQPPRFARASLHLPCARQGIDVCPLVLPEVREFITRHTALDANSASAAKIKARLTIHVLKIDR